MSSRNDSCRDGKRRGIETLRGFALLFISNPRSNHNQNDRACVIESDFSFFRLFWDTWRSCYICVDVIGGCCFKWKSRGKKVGPSVFFFLNLNFTAEQTASAAQSRVASSSRLLVKENQHNTWVGIGVREWCQGREDLLFAQLHKIFDCDTHDYWVCHLSLYHSLKAKFKVLFAFCFKLGSIYFYTCISRKNIKMFNSNAACAELQHTSIMGSLLKIINYFWKGLPWPLFWIF